MLRQGRGDFVPHDVGLWVAVEEKEGLTAATDAGVEGNAVGGDFVCGEVWEHGGSLICNDITCSKLSKTELGRK